MVDVKMDQVEAGASSRGWAGRACWEVSVRLDTLARQELRGPNANVTVGAEDSRTADTHIHKEARTEALDHGRGSVLRDNHSSTGCNRVEDLGSHTRDQMHRLWDRRALGKTKVMPHENDVSCSTHSDCTPTSVTVMTTQPNRHADPLSSPSQRVRTTRSPWPPSSRSHPPH